MKPLEWDCAGQYLRFLVTGGRSRFISPSRKNAGSRISQKRGQVSHFNIAAGFGTLDVEIWELTPYDFSMADTLERKIGGLTVRIDRETCIGTGNCIIVAEDVFEFDDQSVCAFVDDAAGTDRDKLIEACRICPVDALILIDENDKQIVP